MSHSDNTPWQPCRPDGPWENDPYAARLLPRGVGREMRRRWHKAQRGRARVALQRHEEPEPARPRHSVIYDYW